MKKILIVAGEASSDMHAANLVKNIRSLYSDIGFFGLGGNNMRDAGVDLLEDIVHMAFIGPGGLFKAYAKLRKILFNTLDYVKDNPPVCAILIDYAEFNLRLAKKLKALNIPVIYYISPQVWAWGLWRVKTIKKLVDKMLVFFKFEEKLYKEYGIDAKFIGHPLLDTVKTTNVKNDIRKSFGISDDSKIVGVLPGSRKSEIKNILPVMIKACQLILENRQHMKIVFILPLADTIDEKDARDIIAKSGVEIKIVKGQAYNAMSICDCAMVASGTATLETALLGVPMAIIYKTNFLTFLMTRMVIKLPYIGLVNVVAGEKIVPEFLQYQARPEKIAKYINILLADDGLAATAKNKFDKIRKSLGSPGAGMRAASEIVGFLDRAKQTKL